MYLVDIQLALLCINNMKVIYGKQTAEVLAKRTTVLELDTFFQVGLTEPITAYAVLEATNIPLQEIPVMDKTIDLHNTMMLEYKKRNWDYCEQALDHLRGRWGGEIDSFYSIFWDRIQELKEEELPDSWTGIMMSN